MNPIGTSIYSIDGYLSGTNLLEKLRLAKLRVVELTLEDIGSFARAVRAVFGGRLASTQLATH